MNRCSICTYSCLIYIENDKKNDEKEFQPNKSNILKKHTCFSLFLAKANVTRPIKLSSISSYASFIAKSAANSSCSHGSVAARSSQMPSEKK